MAKDLWIIDYPDGSRDIIEPSFDTHVDPVTHAIIATYAEKTQHFPPRYPMDVSSARSRGTPRLLPTEYLDAMREQLERATRAGITQQDLYDQRMIERMLWPKPDDQPRDERAL